MNEWLCAAAVLTAAMLPLVVVGVRRPPLEGLVALELAGIDTTLILLLVSEGTRRQPFADLALVLAVVSFVGSIAFIRFVERVR